MKASEIFAPYSNSEKLTDLETGFLNAVKNGWYVPIQWAEITSKAGEHEAKIMVASDALRIGEPGDSVRVDASHTLEQQIADILGLTYPTTKIADLIHQQASVLVTPAIQSDSVNNGTMAHLSAMLRHSQEVDAKVGGRSGLVSTAGKHWVLTNKLGSKTDVGANYGWFDKSAPYASPGGLKMWQTLGTAHNRFHTDYSQTVTLVHPFMVVDGRNMLLWDVMADEGYAPLVSYEGVIKYSRHPNVEPPPGGVVPAPPVSGSFGAAKLLNLAVLAFTAWAGWTLATRMMG